MKLSFLSIAGVVLVLIFLVATFRIANQNSESGDGAQKASEVVKFGESQESSRINDDETAQEIFANPYIKHIRPALDGYLDGSNIGVEETALSAVGMDECGLNTFDKSYYKSKFLIFDAKNNEYGGVQTWVVFVDKPDTLFWVWVYRLGGDGEYVLRGFCKAGPSDDKKTEFTNVVTKMINDGEMTL